jgi:hypothetical protein
MGLPTSRVPVCRRKAEGVGGEQGGRKGSGTVSSEADSPLDTILVSGNLNFPQEVHLPSVGSTSLKQNQSV